MKTNLNFVHLLTQKRVAFIGVYEDQLRVGHTGAMGLMKNLIKVGYQGNIYPMSSKNQKIMGYKAYPDIQSLPEQVDCIVIGLKRGMVLPVVEESIKKGIKSALIITSGSRRKYIGGKKKRYRLQ